jgi:hypothetical protein
LGKFVHFEGKFFNLEVIFFLLLVKFVPFWGKLFHFEVNSSSFAATYPVFGASSSILGENLPQAISFSFGANSSILELNSDFYTSAEIWYLFWKRYQYGLNVL